MEDNDGFTLVTASKRTPKLLDKSPPRTNTQTARDMNSPDKETTEKDKTMTNNREKIRISMKYGINYNSVKGEMPQKGVSRLRELFNIMFRLEPTLELHSATQNRCLHQSAKFPSEDDVHTFFQTEKYSRKDGSGRTNYFMSVEGHAGKIIQSLKQHSEFTDSLRGNSIFIFAHRHETARLVLLVTCLTNCQRPRTWTGSATIWKQKWHRREVSQLATAI
jgi:hypothetical protein